MADMHALLVIVDGGVAVGLVRGAPVQVVDVADDGRFDARVLGRVVVFPDKRGDAFHRARHHPHPAYQVRVQLTWMGGLRAGVVVEPGGEDVAVGAAAPAVGFFGGVGDAVVGFDVAALGFAEPGVVAFEEGVEGFEVGDGVGRVVEVGVADGVEAVFGGWDGGLGVELVDERFEDEEKRWWVCVVWILNGELLGDFATGFWS